MAYSGIKLNPDDPFDKILFVEEKILQDGYNVGFINGQMEGVDEGYSLGVQQGKEIGREIGFYKGFVCMWLSLTEEGNIDQQGRSRKLLTQLQELLKNCTSKDPENDDLQELLGQIRSKFKQLCAVLKIPTTLKPDEKSKLMF